MVQLTLPKNSKPAEGKTWKRPAGARNVTAFRIYRWNPDDGANPRIDTYFVDRDDCAPMVLDALIWIKNKIDPTLTLRLAGALKKGLGDAVVVEMPAKMTSEDFSEYGLAGVPSALLHVGAVHPTKLAAARQSGIPVPAPHSPEWAPEREPTLKGAIRAETTALLELFRER